MDIYTVCKLITPDVICNVYGLFGQVKYYRNLSDECVYCTLSTQVTDLHKIYFFMNVIMQEILSMNRYLGLLADIYFNIH